MEDEQKLRKALHKVLEKIYEMLHQKIAVLYEDDMFEWIPPSNNYYLERISGSTSREIVQKSRLSNVKIFLLLCTVECEVEILKSVSASTDVKSDCYYWLTMRNELMELDLNGTINLVKVNGEISSESDDINLNFLQARRSEVRKFHFFSPTFSCNKRVLRVAIAESIPLIFESQQSFNDHNSCNSFSKVCKYYNNINGTVTVEYKCCYGLFIDILMKLEHDMNFESDLYLVRDGYYGIQINGTWNGIVADLINGKADIGLAVSINTERSHFIDFPDPFLSDNIAILTTAEKDSTFNLQLNSPFKTNLWIVSLLALFGICFLLFLFEKIGANGAAKFTYIDSIGYVVSLCIGKEIGAVNPNILSARVVAISIAMGTMILISTYIAVMAANFAENEIKPVVSGFTELITKSNLFQYGMVSSTAYAAYFQHASDPNVRLLFSSSNKREYQRLEEGIQMLYAQRLQAFIYSEFELKHYVCQDYQSILYKPKDRIKLTGVTAALQKGSTLTPEINKWVRANKMEGIMKGFEDKWLKQKCITHEKEVPVINIKAFSVAFILLIVGVIFSLLLMLLEMLYKNIKWKT